MDIVSIATKFVEAHPDFLKNFYGMAMEYQNVCVRFDLDRESLPMSSAFFDEFDQFLELMGEVSNG